MKQPEYKEGPKALENFERRMTALFKVPKAAIVQVKKRRVGHFKVESLTRVAFDRWD